MVDCPYKDKCVSYPHKCNTCKHNKEREDFYEPIDNYYKPVIINPHWRRHYCQWY